jgi:serine/threonine-protein kinase
MDRTRDYLFEFWTFDIPNGQYNGPGANAVFGSFWDLTQDYGWNAVQGLAETHDMGRGRDCTSSDAAGFPITPLLPLPEEIASGQINHALRLVLPNGSIMFRRFVKPATHATFSAGGENSFPYGTQLRLRPDSYLLEKYASFGLQKGEDGNLRGTLNGRKYNYDLYPNLRVTAGANALIDAMQKYGVFLADGGSYALTIASHETSEQKYCQNPVEGCPTCCYEDPDRILGAFDLSFLDITDFEVIDNGPTYFCYREDCQPLYEENWQDR